MGKSQRDKGNRVEYLVRDKIRAAGFEVDRVPASGAAQGFKGDLRVRNNGDELLVEVKARKDEFDTLYKTMENNGNVPLFMVDGALITFKPRDVITAEFINTRALIPTPRLEKLLIKLKRYMGPCDLLVVKGDYQEPIYIRWYAVESIEPLTKAGNA